MTTIDQELLTWREQAKWILERFSKTLSEKELIFVSDMAEQESLPSLKQLDWLGRIYTYWFRVYSRTK